MVIRILLLVLFVCLLSGCDAIDDMKGILEKQEIAQAEIKDKYGWESQLGFNINNGVLTQVTIVLDADDVREETVDSLEKIIREVVAKVFKSKPKVIYIQISSVPAGDS